MRFLPPLIQPFKGISKDGKRLPLLFLQTNGYRSYALTFFRVHGGFRERREAGRNHFHLSWYLSDSMVPSYGQKHWRGNKNVSTVGPYNSPPPKKTMRFIGLNRYLQVFRCFFRVCFLQTSSNTFESLVSLPNTCPEKAQACPPNLLQTIPQHMPRTSLKPSKHSPKHVKHIAG